MAKRGRGKAWPKFPRLDGKILLLLMLSALAMAGWSWLQENPQHNPRAPLDLRDPHGLATGAKLAALRGDIPACHTVLTRSNVAFTALEPVADGECARPDRLTLSALPLSPANAQMTCPVAAGLAKWMEQDVQRLARELLGSEVQRAEQLGTYSCRRMYGAATGDWSEHATGNAIDISAFILEDGRRVSLLNDWDADEVGADAEARFLRALRDAACRSFGTVLSPDYNSAHADHFHLDQGRAPDIGVCR